MWMSKRKDVILDNIKFYVMYYLLVINFKWIIELW